MQSATYKTKSGHTQYKPVVSDEEMSEIMADGNMGFCLACGNEADGVEPDARKYECENCGAEKVYGFEELLIMGLVQISVEVE